MKQYNIHLLALSVVLGIIAVMLKLFCGGAFTMLLAYAVLYFLLVALLQHLIIVRSMEKDPRTFVKRFLLVSVGTMVLHLAVVFVYAMSRLLTHQTEGTKLMIIAFAVLFVVYLIFETVELLLHVRRQKKQENPAETEGSTAQENEID